MNAQMVQLVVAILGSSGVLDGIYALLKLRPESGQIVVTAAQGALVIQSGVLEQLQRENERLRQRVTALELELAKLRNEVHEDKETP